MHEIIVNVIGLKFSANQKKDTEIEIYKHPTCKIVIKKSVLNLNFHEKLKVA